jgi:hypothetical protein
MFHHQLFRTIFPTVRPKMTTFWKRLSWIVATVSMTMELWMWTYIVVILNVPRVFIHNPKTSTTTSLRLALRVLFVLDNMHGLKTLLGKQDLWQ